MKKITLSLLLISALFLVGCSSDSNNEESQTSSTTASSTSEASSEIKDGKTSCGEPLLDPEKQHSVVFNTNKGSFTVELDVQNAPISTAHLAALVSSKFYDGLTFHRVVPDFVIQGGDPEGNGTGSSECSVISEEPPRDYKQGDFAWAKGGADPAGKAGSQFFIITGGPSSQSGLSQKVPQSDGTSKIQYGYAGTVIDGLDVALAIEALAPGGDGPPTETVTITSAELKS